MIPKGPSTSVRQNPYAGPEELKLKKALDARLYEIGEVKKAWSNGGGDLDELSRTLKGQREILKGYSSAAGDAAVETYTYVIGIVDERMKVMLKVAEAVDDAHGAVEQAMQDYITLPPVTGPATGDPTAGITGHGKKAIEARKEAMKAANETNEAHTSSVNAAETKAREARIRLENSMEQATAKIRPVAGLDKPSNVTNADTTADSTPTTVRPTRSNPGVISTPEDSTITPVETKPHVINSNPNHTDPETHHNIPGPNSDPNTNPHDGHLLGPVQTNTPPVVNTPGPVNTTPVTPGPTSTNVSPVVAPPLSTAAISRTATPVPGTNVARTNPIGRSSATASRGVLGRNAMMPGQTAAGRTGTTGARGARGMMPGQAGTKGARGTAGSRGARGAGGRGMVPGTGGGKGQGKGRDRKGEAVELLWDDGKDWLGDDETSPEVLG